MQNRHMAVLPYLIIFAIPVLGFLGTYFKGVLLLGCPLFAFGLFPVIDFVGGLNLQAHVQRDLKSPFFKIILYAYVVVELIYLVYTAHVYAGSTTFEQWALIFQSGIVTGAIGITLAHELMHKNDRFSIFCAEVLLLMVSYPHYIVEHVLGHHTHVGTRGDPATARLGESYYRFFPRTFFGGILSAWKIEKKRLARKNKGVFHFENKMLWYLSLPLMVDFLIFIFFGWPLVIFFVAQSFVAVNLLEIVNYTEHYGLTRKETEHGRYERVTEKHSWESKSRLTNLLLINLQLHSDHHMHPTKPYQELVSMEKSPQLPFGYATMAVIALFPPLFRRLIDPRLRALK